MFAFLTSEFMNFKDFLGLDHFSGKSPKCGYFFSGHPLSQ